MTFFFVLSIKTIVSSVRLIFQRPNLLLGQLYVLRCKIFMWVLIDQCKTKIGSSTMVEG